MSMMRRGDLFNSWVYADIIIADAQKKNKCGLYPELNYDTIVKSIAQWMNGWMRFTMPRPDELIDLISDAFLLIMKAKRRDVSEANYEAFVEALRVDVYRALMKYLENCDKGVKTYYKLKTKKI